MENLTSLKELQLYRCEKLSKLPKGLWRGMQALQVLNLSECESLKVLPVGLELLVSLTKLDLRRKLAGKSIPSEVFDSLQAQGCLILVSGSFECEVCADAQCLSVAATLK